MTAIETYETYGTGSIMDGRKWNVGGATGWTYETALKHLQATEPDTKLRKVESVPQDYGSIACNLWQ